MWARDTRTSEIDEDRMARHRKLEVFGFAATILLLGGCANQKLQSFPTEETFAPGILLEPEERAALPDGVELRGVYEKGIRSTKA